VSEERLFQALMISCAVLAGLCGLGAVGLIVQCAMTFSLGVLVCALLLAAGAVGAAYSATAFASRAQAPKVFNNQDEKEVLTMKQRRELKRKRGAVVMEKALIEVEQERDNIVHHLQLDSADPDKPPYQTRWTVHEEPRQIKARLDPDRVTCAHGHGKGQCVFAGCENY